MAGVEQPDAEAIDARVVKALAHPTRVRILEVLRSRELVSPVELSNELGLALGTVGYHVRRLETLGFIELAKRTQRRGAVEHHYRARAELDPPAPPPVRRRGGRVHRGGLAQEAVHEAQEAVAHGAFDAVTTRCDRRLLALDARGRTQLGSAVAELIGTIEQIEQASVQRLGRARGSARPCTAVVMAFETEQPLEELS